MLEIRGLHKIYGKYHALSGLDMTVETGALYGFVGPNGAGKTTTIKIMTGLLEAEEGRITINGMDARADLGKLKSMIGYVPDFFGVYDNLTVSEYMEFFAACHHINGLVARKRYTALLEQVGLGDKLKNKPNQLSGGQQQRVSIARALVRNPAIILADEPTGALDSHTGREVLGMLQDLHGQGHTVVLITHDNSIAVQADRIIRLEDGQVVYDGDSRAPEAIVQPTLNFEPAEQEGNK